MSDAEEIILLKAEKERLEKELVEVDKQLNWLAERAAENPCPVKPEECPQNGEDGFDTDICTQCWKEAARKAMEE